jgi:hypothetical protein
VVVDIQSYEQTQDAFTLLKLISQSEQDLRKGKFLSQSQMEALLKKRFGI